MKRYRRFGSIKQELLSKSREAALAAIQIFNSPLVTFKSEIFVVNMHIAWTYLLHAYYREQKIDYRYVKKVGPMGRRLFETTPSGAPKYWSLRDCLSNSSSPVPKNAWNNLLFLIGLRDEIEHRMTSKIDDALSAKFQACCLNYNSLVKDLFGKKYGIDRHLTFSLQLTALTNDQLQVSDNYSDLLPAHIRDFVRSYDDNLSVEEFNSTEYAYRVLFTPKTVNRPNQADRVIEFIKPDSEIAQGMNTAYTVVKEREKIKHVPTKIVKQMNTEGFPEFKLQDHIRLWQKHDGKNPAKGYGVELEGRWYWYESWITVVRQYCKNNTARYGSSAK